MTKIEIELPSELESVDKAAAQAAQIAAQANLPEDALFGIDLAVRETVANAVKHGNQFDANKKVGITFEIAAQKFIITVTDEGVGFDLNQVPDPTNAENLMKESGRGILFIRSFMDEVTWRNRENGHGTIVSLTKNF